MQGSPNSPLGTMGGQPGNGMGGQNNGYGGNGQNNGSTPSNGLNALLGQFQ